MYLLMRKTTPYMIHPNCLGNFDDMLAIGIAQTKEDVMDYADSRMPERVPIEISEWVTLDDQLIRLIILHPNTPFELYLWEVIRPIPDITLKG